MRLLCTDWGLGEAFQEVLRPLCEGDLLSFPKHRQGIGVPRLQSFAEHPMCFFFVLGVG